MSFKVNSLTARVVKAESVSRWECIVTLVVLIIALAVFTYPIYFAAPSVYLYAVACMKLTMGSVVLFDSVSMLKDWLKKA